MSDSKKIDDEIARVVQSVNDWDDRTSPDDYPDHLLITSEELTLILREFAAAIDCSSELLEALVHARNQIQHPDQMIDEAIAKAGG